MASPFVPAGRQALDGDEQLGVGGDAGAAGCPAVDPLDAAQGDGAVLVEVEEHLRASLAGAGRCRVAGLHAEVGAGEPEDLQQAAGRAGGDVGDVDAVDGADAGMALVVDAEAVHGGDGGCAADDLRGGDVDAHCRGEGAGEAGDLNLGLDALNVGVGEGAAGLGVVLEADEVADGGAAAAADLGEAGDGDDVGGSGVGGGDDLALEAGDAGGGGGKDGVAADVHDAGGRVGVVGGEVAEGGGADVEVAVDVGVADEGDVLAGDGQADAVDAGAVLDGLAGGEAEAGAEGLQGSPGLGLGEGAVDGVRVGGGGVCVDLRLGLSAGFVLRVVVVAEAGERAVVGDAA